MRRAGEGLFTYYPHPPPLVYIYIYVHGHICFETGVQVATFSAKLSALFSSLSFYKYCATNQSSKLTVINQSI